VDLHCRLPVACCLLPVSEDPPSENVRKQADMARFFADDLS
jgi:hypothetical protein